MYAFFWLLYISHLALNIFYPLKSAKLFNSRTIYIMELLLVFVIGATPSIVNAALSHYEIIFFPPTQCGNNDAIHFYEAILPCMICITISGILMLLILYKIHVVSILFTQSLIRTIRSCSFHTHRSSELLYLNLNHACMHVAIDFTIPTACM